MARSQIVDERLQPKPGSTFDTSQIVARIGHTIAQGAGG